jgi:hypothetical protein
MNPRRRKYSHVLAAGNGGFVEVADAMPPED